MTNVVESLTLDETKVIFVLFLSFTTAVTLHDIVIEINIAPFIIG
jgi:hypothetical protein